MKWGPYTITDMPQLIQLPRLIAGLTPRIYSHQSSRIYTRTNPKSCITIILRLAPTRRNAAAAIKCYQCTSADTMDCSDLIVNMADGPLQPLECDHVHGAAFCVKSTALNG